MRTVNKILLWTAAIGGVGATVIAMQSPSPDHLFRDACEYVLKDRLKAPATYRFVRMTPIETRLATLDEYMGWTDAEVKVRGQEMAKRDPKLARAQDAKRELFDLGNAHLVGAFLEYDAANSFGTPIRGIANCTLTTTGDVYEPSPLDRHMMRVNGLSATEWVISLMRDGS